MASGGGWGDPLLRDPELVAKDTRSHLISYEKALLYGVVLTDKLNVDATATEALRSQLLHVRPEVIPVFNRGGTLKELFASCEAEVRKS